MNTSDMAPQSKDPAFKLFGRKIPVPETKAPPKDNCSEMTTAGTECPSEDNSGRLDKNLGQCQEENESPVQVNKGHVSGKAMEGQVDNSNTDQDKVFKKPDKVIPCPRCNSLETKFCYFNNYNVNQPRHFCKNCQRYWTAGGTMRNVPIGAGRRKNKHLASQYRQILVSSDGIPITRMENSDSPKNQLASSVGSAADLRPPTGNGIVLKFGSEAPLCESMETVLNLGDQNKYVEANSTNCRDNGDEPSSSGSSMTAASIRGNELPEIAAPKEQAVLSGSPNDSSSSQAVHCYPVPPLVFPWNPGWKNVATMAATQSFPPNGNSPGQVQWCPTPMMTVPGFCPPNIPLQFVPASYWGCVPVWAGAPGNMSLSGGSNGCLSPSSSTSTGCCSGNDSPTLGKHSRDSNFVEEEKAEKYILVPKTVRVDDMSEGSRSPLWAALGLKSDPKDPISKGSIFKTFDTKAGRNGHASDATPILEANPAALSRSHTFRESS
ncbi:hypothetical protein Tsubulata_037069 [Turnera subulata]|uniref:Dof-type domain-containing protein n=1 Tax=Turnera subulata TaxID=218843 RepID=A0A9Q0GET2_9ROSI|nr:hypothetical protein Tsubulata_037069 [Turnera subulata]